MSRLKESDKEIGGDFQYTITRHKKDLISRVRVVQLRGKEEFHRTGYYGK